MEKLASPTKVILLDLSDEDSIERLGARRVCGDCGDMGQAALRPKRELCGNCGGVLNRRLDDSEEAIKERLRLYHHETEPLIAFYEKSDRLFKVDGRPSMEKIHEEIRRIF